jgi:hypothetical protein
MGARPSTRAKARARRASSGRLFLGHALREDARGFNQVGSLSIVSACKGEDVTAVRTRQVWRAETSNMFTGAMVRRQKVSRERR